MNALAGVLELTAGPKVGPSHGRRGKGLLADDLRRKTDKHFPVKLQQRPQGWELERIVEHYAG